jgi:hypothetical protein
MSRGAWGLPARRIWEAGASTLPVMGLLLLPILLGMKDLYSWLTPEKLSKTAQELVHAKHWYLSSGFFIGRAVLYFAVWIGLTVALKRLSSAQDEGQRAAQRMQVVAAPGLLAFAFTVTFASFDWLMSLEPDWYSTIYGVWLMVGSALAALAFTILVAHWLGRQQPMNAAFGARHFHDYGKLTFAFTVLWTYVTFSQFLIIWSANLPAEIGWYLDRNKNGWQYVVALLVLCQFAIPFILLLSRDRKRHAGRLVKVALLVIAMRAVDFFWQIKPTFSSESIAPHWLDAATLVGIGGLWLWLFTRQLASRPLLPVNAPNLAESLGDE